MKNLFVLIARIVQYITYDLIPEDKKFWQEESETRKSLFEMEINIGPKQENGEQEKVPRATLTPLGEKLLGTLPWDQN